MLQTMIIRLKIEWLNWISRKNISIFLFFSYVPSCLG